MADFSWSVQSPLSRALLPGHHGISGTPGVTLTERRDVLLVQVMSRRGKAAAVSAAAQSLFGIAPPERPSAVSRDGVTLVWSGPDQFTIVAPRADEAARQEAIAEAFAGSASLSVQSDGRCALRIAGPRARDTIAKFSSLDLHDSVFPPGSAAATSIDHTAVNFWREADDAAGNPVFNILVFTSFADSLWHTMLDSALEYGAEVTATA